MVFFEKLTGQFQGSTQNFLLLNLRMLYLKVLSYRHLSNLIKKIIQPL